MGHRPDWNNKNFKKTSVRGFADGGEVDTYEFGRYDEQQENKARYERDMAQMDRDAQEASRELSTIAEAKPEPKKAMSFSQAFAENRKAGNSTFEWNGKKYSTELAKAAPRGDQKVKKMYEDAAKAGRDYRAAAATAKTESDRKILLNAAAESENKARLFGAGYANTVKK